MSSGLSADPFALKALSGAYTEIGGILHVIGELSVDRVALLREACGDDDMGEEIKKNLAPSADKIEKAMLAISEVVKNQTNVTKGLANKLAATENENIANVGRNLRR